MKYLDENGLLYLVQKIKTWLSGKANSTHSHTISEITDYHEYELPTASAETKGGIKVGAGLAINNGILSATGGGTADAVDWENVQNKPTKLSDFTNDGDGTQGSAFATEDYVDTNGGKIDKIKVNGTEQEITNKAVDISVPTNTNQLTNGAGFITGITNSDVITALGFTPYNSTNPNGYQTANDVSTAIGSAIAGIQGISYSVVASLPTTGEAGVIYLVSNSGSNPNIYDEYIYVNNAFEKIGTTDIDLSGYVEESDLAAITNEEIDTICA